MPSKGGEDTCLINARPPNGTNRIIVLFITGVFNLDTEINGACLEGRSGLVSFKTRRFDELLVNTHVALITVSSP